VDLFRDLSYRCATQTSASTPLPSEQPILLAGFWGTLHPDCPSHSLLADWKTMSGRCDTSDPFAPLLGYVHIYSYFDAIY